MLHIVSHPDYDIPLADGHRFPSRKFTRLISHLDAEGILAEFTHATPIPATIEALSQIHDPNYVASIHDGSITTEALRVLGFEWSEALARRSFLAPNGTLMTARLAREHGLACHAAGGTHHAHYGHGAGFCVFNDIAFTAINLLRDPGIDQVLILDCDVHQGDGTARMLMDEDRAVTVSLHCATNYPARKAISDFDIELDRGLDNEGYLAILADTLSKLAGVMRPDIVIYDAGVDIHIDDRLGYLNVTDQGLRARDDMVLAHFLARDIPVATVIGGGYDKDVAALISRHAHIFKASADAYAHYCR
ncbi:histone deacetylase family protein [Candidatus Puniceispirillum marinum]|uniref:Histone deacetylase superfamily n=1 Tax=Puniceispirillum marinum (strain IMCC1322) TaxID=488538 RepID=D5BQY3_PUNMI|nr:histone deacetylase [Candidatus Puniceispirillum marinum]ADE38697.1 histone deacetylase superfamily [Candidatus Puniceispirillum marinum IMCC1322]